MSATADVVVVGAGIVGAACALELAQERLRVAVLDEAGIGTGATAASMGHIVVMDDSEAQFALTRYSQMLWDELRPQLPLSVEFEQRGTIWVAADDEEMAAEFIRSSMTKPVAAFFSNDTAPPESYARSLHGAVPSSVRTLGNPNGGGKSHENTDRKLQGVQRIEVSAKAVHGRLSRYGRRELAAMRLRQRGNS